MIAQDRVLTSLAKHLATQGLVQYHETAPYTENPLLPAVTFGALPKDVPTAVSLNVYNYDPQRDKYNPDVYVQLRFRAGVAFNPLAVHRLADKVFAELDWPENKDPELWPGGVRVQHVCRVVSGLVTPDGNNRYERPDSYRITLNPGE